MSSKEIDVNQTVAQIVKNDYRTADVFRKHGIEFCCGGNRSLTQACEARNVDTAAVVEELERAGRGIAIPANVFAEDWNLNFLTDYITNVHHQYLKNSLAPAADYLQRFVDGHSNIYPRLPELQRVFKELVSEMLPHLREEEEIIFPYIRQIADAYYNNEPYARLLVRTLRKPVEKFLQIEHQSVVGYLTTIRNLTDNYTPPASACLNHQVCFLKLREIDVDLIQHLHLETAILFPKAIQLEKELLQKDS